MNEEKALMVRDEQSVAVAAPRVDELMNAVIAAARDPGCDVGKMEKLIELAERMEARQQEAAFREDMDRLQDELPMIFRGRLNKSTGSAYADLNDISKAIRPLLVKHGFRLDHTSKPMEGEKMLVTTRLIHRAGHFTEHSIPIAVSATGAKGGGVMTATQAAGNALSYAKRYNVCMALNITFKDEDDDGQGGKITDEQATKLDQLIASSGAKVEAFLRVYGVEKVADLPASMFTPAKQMLIAKSRQSS